MASASYTEDLTCSICLTIFTDPVSLLCGHSFCRKCITISLSVQKLCPQCRTTVTTEEKSLPTNHILKSLAEKAIDAEKIKNEQRHEKTEVAECLCTEHEEKLKLFCETDQQLACVICRDGERHDGHKFKPIKEAATSLRRELEKGLENLPGDIHALESLANTQREEITKTQATSQQLMTQISSQFEEMHQFLRKREEEIKNELQEKERGAVEEMTDKLNAMNMALSESRELEVKVTSALEVSDSVKFLHSWTEFNNMRTPESLFRPRANDLQVAQTSLCLGPYESHLQFFVWKEMLQVIKPQAEQLSLRRDNTNLTVSHDGRSLLGAPRRSQSQPGFTSGSTQASSSFGFGSTRRSDFTQVSDQRDFSATLRDIEGLDRLRKRNNLSKISSSETYYDRNANHAVSINEFTSGRSLLGNPGSSKASGAFAFCPPQASHSSGFGSSAFSLFGFGSTQASGSSGFGSSQAHSAFGAFHDNKQPNQSSFAIKTNHAVSINEFTSGQHYWETEVGQRDYWELGLEENFLKFHGQKYAICNQSSVTELPFTDRPRKIGIYLNCSSKELSFYDADSMKHVHTVSSSLMSLPVSAYFNIGYSQYTYPNPLTVCWY